MAAPPAKGYPELAFLISTDMDFSIFRKFDELSARNLLRMQAELTIIEDELCMMDSSAENGYEPHIMDMARREALMSRLEILMGKYHKALILQNHVHQLSSPTAGMASKFDYWIHRAANKQTVGDVDAEDYVPPQGPDTPADYWRLRDYVLLKYPVIPDSWMERFTRRYLGKMFQDKRPVPPTWDGYYFSRAKVERIKDWLAFPLASVFLIAPALLFYYICDGSKRIAILLSFIAGLALLVQIFMGTTRHQTLAAALAYTGVLGLLISAGESNGCKVLTPR